jgi:hypothetical protein
MKILGRASGVEVVSVVLNVVVDVVVVDVVVVGVVVIVVVVVEAGIGDEADKPFLWRARSTKFANVTEELNEN